jgi:hypothetical protein
MKEDRNFKVRIHNGPYGDHVYLINAETHYDAYQRFCGIMINNGYYHSRAIWRALNGTSPTLAQVRKYGRGRKNRRTIRTYFFYPKNIHPAKTPSQRRLHEAAIEIIKLK